MFSIDTLKALSSAPVLPADIKAGVYPALVKDVKVVAPTATKKGYLDIVLDVQADGCIYTQHQLVFNWNAGPQLSKDGRSYDPQGFILRPLRAHMDSPAASLAEALTWAASNPVKVAVTYAEASRFATTEICYPDFTLEAPVASAPVDLSGLSNIEL